MVAAQASREQRLALADDVVVNDGPLDALQRAVTQLHTGYLRRAAC
ncbi:dephospho-CoA kinase [Xanthomonas sp. 60]